METMKHDSKIKTTQPSMMKQANAVIVELAAMEGIPVYELTFCVGMNNKPDLPLSDSYGGLGKLRIRPDREITYLPKMLFYRVVQISRDPRVKTKTFYIPREWATFEPLE
jgi:hypothetical protein